MIRALAKGINFLNFTRSISRENNVNVHLHHQLPNKIRTIVHAIDAKVSIMIQSSTRLLQNRAIALVHIAHQTICYGDLLVAPYMD